MRCLLGHYEEANRQSSKSTRRFETFRTLDCESPGSSKIIGPGLRFPGSNERPAVTQLGIDSFVRPLKIIGIPRRNTIEFCPILWYKFDLIGFDSAVFTTTGELDMKSIFFFVLLPIFAFGQSAHADPCQETPDKTIKRIVTPDQANSTIPITEALKAFKPGFNLIIEVQPGTYSGENGIAIRDAGVCLLGKGKPVIKRTKFDNEMFEPSIIKVWDVSDVVIAGFELVGTIKGDNCPVVTTGIAVVNFSKGPISNFRIADNFIHTIGQDYSAHCFNPDRSEIVKQAHGIQVVSNDDLVEKITIDHNTLSNLRLGQSEAITLGGRIKDFTITSNSISDVDNIGIDIIGKSEGTSFQATKGRIAWNTISDLKPGNSSYPFVAGIYIDGGTGLSWGENIAIENNTVNNFGIGISIGSENNYCDKNKTKKTKDECPVLTQFITIDNNILRDNQLYGIGIGKDVYDDKDRQNSRTWNVRITGNSVIGNVTSTTASHKSFGQIHVGSLEKESLKSIELRNNVIATNNGSLLVSLGGSEEKKYLIPDVSFYDNQFSVDNDSQVVWSWGESEQSITRYKRPALVMSGSPIVKLPKAIKGENNIWKPL